MPRRKSNPFINFFKYAPEDAVKSVVIQLCSTSYIKNLTSLRLTCKQIKNSLDELLTRHFDPESTQLIVSHCLVQRPNGFRVKLFPTHVMLYKCIRIWLNLAKSLAASFKKQEFEITRGEWTAVQQDLHLEVTKSYIYNMAELLIKYIKTAELSKCNESHQRLFRVVDKKVNEFAVVSGEYASTIKEWHKIRDTILV